jgi:hypothetical protein
MGEVLKTAGMLVAVSTLNRNPNCANKRFVPLKEIQWMKKKPVEIWK